MVPESLEGTPLEITHINLLDNTVEGVSCERDSIFSVQYHPESAPGPQHILCPLCFACYTDIVSPMICEMLTAA